jgi:hypothetical protein
MSEIAEYNINIVQGETWKMTLELTEDNGSASPLTNYNVEMKIRKYYNYPVIEDLTIDNGMIDNTDFADGIIYFKIPAEKTVDYDFDIAKYDIKITSPDDEVLFLIEGNIIINRSITI